MAGERIEAEMTVPASTTASASNGAQSAAVTITVTAGDYFPTDLCTQLQTQLNTNVLSLPQTASALASAIGYGDWSTGAGWLCQDTATPLLAAFGSPSLTAVSTPTYRTAGFTTGDYAVGFDSASDAFSGGDVFDATATDDLIIAWVGKFSSSASLLDVFGKFSGAGAGWLLYENSNSLVFAVRDGVDQTGPSNGSVLEGVWHVGIAVLDRATNMARVGIRAIDGSSSSVSAEDSCAIVGTLANASDLVIGADATFGAPTNFLCSAFYIVSGSAVATGLSANLATALTSFATWVNGSWSVAMSTTTGLTTISHSSQPATVDFASANLQEVLGFEYDFDYPQTAAQLTTALGGYGDFATAGAGWLLNDTATPLGAVFGSPSLAAVATPTYNNVGPRGGADRAVGFDSGTDAFNGGDVYGAGAGDLILVFVAKLTSTANGDLMGKGWATGGYLVEVDSAGLQFYTTDGTHVVGSFAAGVPKNEWFAVICCVDRAANAVRCAFQGLRTGTQVIGPATSATTLGSMYTATNFTLGSSGSYGAHTASQIGVVYIATGALCATGLSANISAALTSFSSYMTSQTGTMVSSGAWFPGCNLMADSDPKQAPRGDDGRATVGPDGSVYGLASTLYYRHRNVRFSHVSKVKVWANDATTVGADYETWFLETQRGQHSWFSPYSRVRVYWDNAGTATELGYGDVDAWKMPKPAKLDDLKLAAAPWTGLVEINLGDLYSSG